MGFESTLVSGSAGAANALQVVEPLLRAATAGIVLLCFGLQISFMPLIAREMAEVLGSTSWAWILASTLPVLTLPLGAIVASSGSRAVVIAASALLVVGAIAWLAACSAQRAGLSSAPDCNCLRALMAHEAAVLRTNRAALAGGGVLVAAGSLLCLLTLGVRITPSSGGVLK